MDSRNIQNGGPVQANPPDEPGMAKVSNVAPVQAPAVNSGPNLPGGPYGAYQPAQAPYYAPAPVVPGTERREGLRATNPVLWTVLVVLGVLVTGALILSVVAVLFAARIIGQISNVQVGPLQNESRSVPLGATKSVDVELTMRAGELTVTGGATDLLNADFSYNVSQWKPEISSSIAGDSGSLVVNQPEQGVLTAGKSVNKWDLHLNNSVPINLKANVGAGTTRFQLAGLNVTRAEIIVGAGTTSVDMTGLAGQNADIRVINSVGDTTLIVPSDVGVKVTTVRGVGNINVGNLKGSDGSYTNDAYGKAARNINLYVEVAAGNVVFQTR